MEENPYQSPVESESGESKPKHNYRLLAVKYAVASIVQLAFLALLSPTTKPQVAELGLWFHVGFPAMEQLFTIAFLGLAFGFLACLLAIPICIVRWLTAA